MGRDGNMMELHNLFRSFNPRARMGRDPFYEEHKAILYSFNPRARMGRDFSFSFYFYSHFKFQSTRPHGARLV